jgi:hypothetical protein
MPNPAARELCSFCGKGRHDVAYLFVSGIGGDPTCICDRCIEERMAWLDQDREAPGFLQGVIEMQRAHLAKRWREAHPGSGEVPL